MAAQIQGAAEPGQVVVSQDVWRQLRGRREFCFLDLGDRSLKGIGSIGLYAVTVQGDRLALASPLSDTGEPEGKERAITSVAVLPFADLSAEHDQEYFGDGIAEEILDALTKIGGLHVPARTSCFAFRERVWMRGTSANAFVSRRCLKAAFARPETESASAFN